MMPKIAIFGSQGFIGQNLVDFFSGRRIFTFDRQVGADHVLDLQYHIAQRHAPDLDADTVAVCLASEANVWGVPSTVPVDHEARILDNIVEFCYRRGVRKFIHLSSSNIYGIHDVPFVETMVARPINKYGKQKLLAENRLANLCMMNPDLAVVSVRMFNAIGKYQRKTMFPYLIVSHFIDGQPLPIYGHRRRAWTPVSDLCYFLDKLVHTEMTPGFKVFNYGNSSSITQTRLLLEFAKENIGPVKLDVKPERVEELPYTSADMTKAVSMFGDDIVPSDDLSESIREVITTVYLEKRSSLTSCNTF